MLGFGRAGFAVVAAACLAQLYLPPFAPFAQRGPNVCTGADSCRRLPHLARFSQLGRLGASVGAQRQPRHLFGALRPLRAGQGLRLAPSPERLLGEGRTLRRLPLAKQPNLRFRSQFAYQRSKSAIVARLSADKRVGWRVGPLEAAWRYVAQLADAKGFRKGGSRSGIQYCSRRRVAIGITRAQMLICRATAICARLCVLLFLFVLFFRRGPGRLSILRRAAQSCVTRRECLSDFASIWGMRRQRRRISRSATAAGPACSVSPLRPKTPRLGLYRSCRKGNTYIIIYRAPANNTHPQVCQRI